MNTGKVETADFLPSAVHEAADAHSIIAMTDAPGIVTYVNDNFMRVSGYDREELIGKARRGRRARKHQRLPPLSGRVPIHARSVAANNRSESGHWEADLILFGGQREVVLSVTERKSRLLMLEKMANRTAQTTNTLKGLLAAIPPGRPQKHNI